MILCHKGIPPMPYAFSLLQTVNKDMADVQASVRLTLLPLNVNRQGPELIVSHLQEYVIFPKFLGGFECTTR
jgi:hypothetical protein